LTRETADQNSDELLPLRQALEEVAERFPFIEAVSIYVLSDDGVSFQEI